MRRITLYITGIMLIFICLSCRKEHISPVNQLVKDLFCFKTGSEWIYYDSLSRTTHKMVVTNYEVTKCASMPKGGRKAYVFAEDITINYVVDNTNTGETWLIADEDQDNTARGSVFVPSETLLSIRCNENDNFTPSATHLSTYNVNEIEYKDVYVFNVSNKIHSGNITYTNDYTYYVAKHTGFIRCVYKCEYAEHLNYDWVLINKNVIL